MPRRKTLPWLIAALLCLPAAYAQQFQATVIGTITDASGAKIPGVKVEVKNVGTGVVSTAVTNENGTYETPFLQPGNYTISASSGGFTTAVKNNIELRVGDRYQADFTLQVGGVTEQVTVSTGVQQIETTTADLGQVIGTKSTANLPLLGRNPFQLITVASGVQHIPALASRSDRPFDNGGMDNYNINGSRSFTNEFLLDGAPDNASEGVGTPNNLTIAPPPDATSEFRVQTSTYDAQYGRTGGGTVNVSLKSGTNGFHGALYDYWRNTVLNSNTFDGNLSGQGKVPFHWNQPGVEVDGPVFLPKLYDGRNRTFFMYNWEDVRDTVPYAQTYTVPTAAERAGDFSGLLNSSGQPVTIFDPLTTVAAGGSYARTAFPGNIIQPNRIDPVANNMLNYLPLPNTVGNGFGQNNFTDPSNSRSDRYDIHTFRLDHYLSEKNKFFVDVLRSNRHEVNGNAGYVGAASPLYLHWRTNTAVTGDLTTVLSPTMVLDSRIGFNRHVFAIARHSNGFDPTQLGFPSSFVSQLGGLSFPRIEMGNYFSSPACACFGYTGSTYTYTNTYSWSETLSKTVGSHSLKTGLNFRVIQNNQANPTSSTGTFTFNRGFTQFNPQQADAASGDEFASFLLGTPASGSVPVNAAFAFQSRYYAVFLQDDWRVNDRLTLNLGVRWDYESPNTERYNRQNRGFDISALSPVQVPGFETLYGGLLFTDSNHRNPYQKDLNNFQPRIGLAYKFTPTTVFRAGYGMTYLPTFDIGYNNGFNISTAFNSSVNGGLTPATYLSNPYPNGILQPAGSALGLSTLLGQSFQFSDPYRVVPFVHQFSAQLQQQLPWQTLLSVGYAGSRSRELQIAKAINEIPASAFALGNALLTQIPNPLYNRLPVSSSINTPTVTRQQLLRPYPQFTSITESNIPAGYSSYDSLQVAFDKRFSHGLNFIVSYTYSKALEATSYLNPQDSIDNPARTLSGFDAPHRLSIAGNYALPFFNTGRGWKNAFLGGWQVNAIAYVQSGLPVLAPTTGGGGAPTVNSPASTTYTRGAISTGISPLLSGTTTLGQQFNTCTITLTGTRQNCSSPTQPAAWRIQSPYELSTLSLYLPGVRDRRPPQVNMSMFKTFNLTESLHLQFRAEAFNLTNTPWFGSPTVAVNSARFGQMTKLQTNDPRSLQLALRLNF
jgi:outer membrane receptor protein involved in Fe transport